MRQEWTYPVCQGTPSVFASAVVKSALVFFGPLLLRLLPRLQESIKGLFKSLRGFPSGWFLNLCVQFLGTNIHQCRRAPVYCCFYAVHQEKGLYRFAHPHITVEL